MGSKAWNRSKIMLVGEGRVGKTALSNALMGKPFVETESTVGLTQLTCDVRRASATNSGSWSPRKQPEKEYEQGVAQVIRNIDERKTTVEELSVKTAAESISSVGLKDSILCHDDNYECILEPRNILVWTHGTDIAEVSASISNESVSSKPDVNLVVKCLADEKEHGTDLILSLFDFGGQHVFNIIHHLFLTSYGGYVVVFNMRHMLKYGKRERSLNELSFWISSIVIHTSASRTEAKAPIFLVGTNKDKIKNSRKHDDISNLIRNRFQSHPGWKNIQENNNLCFFPVNNRKNQPKNCIQYFGSFFCNFTQQDDVISNLHKRIIDVLKEANYVKTSRPLTWLKALDEFMSTKKSFLTMEEASTIAVSTGVEVYTVQHFLSFLNEMGVVLWLDERGLRDVVILDIITFFVEPATLIICNHIVNPSSSTIHHKKIQESCRKERWKEWEEMTQRGLVSRQLMEYLLANKVDNSNISVIIDMMLKYGLVVRLLFRQTYDQSSQVSNVATHSSPEYYLVPALLPCTPCDPCVFQDTIWTQIEHFDTCYFVFSIDINIMSTSIGSSQLKSQCFLPRGFMERLIGKVVAWSKLSEITDVNDVKHLYRNYAVLSFENRRFRLIYIAEINCIRLDVDGNHPLPVYNKIYEHVKACVKECMGSLQFITALRLGDATESEEGLRLVNLKALRDVHDEDTTITIEGYVPIDREVVKKRFNLWINKYDDILHSYDVFISHRWHKDDNELSDQLHDAFLVCTVGKEKRAVQVFYDKFRIKKCQQFQRAFGNALINSAVFVPIVCSSALARMYNHNPEEEDNVLIEWMLALECMKDQIHSKMRGVYPIIFGEWNRAGSVGNLSDDLIDRLPQLVPMASIRIATSLLTEKNVNVSSSLNYITVRDVVKEIKKFNGMLCGESQPDTSPSKATKEIIKYYAEHFSDIVEDRE